MKSSTPPLLLSAFSTFSVGGPQVRFCTLANHYCRRLRHVIVAMDDKFDCKSRLAADLDVTYIPIDNRKGDTIGNRRRFRAVLRSLQPDCLVTYNWGAIEWAMANWPRLARHVHIEDGFGREEADRQFPRRVLARRLLLRGSEVCVPSLQLERIAAKFWKIRPTALHYIPNGIDCTRFTDPNVSPLFTGDGRPVLGTLAALRPEKNLVRLLDAFRLVHEEVECRLVIAGDGPDRTRLEKHVAEIGLRDAVLFTGHREDAERVYATLDIFVLSSDTEQMPTTVMEAMAAALPVVATAVGDVKTMLALENLPFVVAPDSRELARALRTLLADEILRQKIGTANRARARSEFGQDKMFAAYGALFLNGQMRTAKVGD